MSLTKLLNVPFKIFRKDVITFLIVRRHDLGSAEEEFRYIAVKPTASISTLRQKIWHLLDLPDYCDEVIILKTSDNIEIPLTELRRGNEPHCPFILEVWLPGRLEQSTTTVNNINMITMGRQDDESVDLMTSSDFKKQDSSINSMENDGRTISRTTMATDTLINKFVFQNNKKLKTAFVQAENLRQIPSCMSNHSLLYKFQGKKSIDNFTTILVKIQNDLTTLSNKLSTLENRIPQCL